MVLVVGGRRQAAWKTRAHFFKRIKAALILKKFFSSLSLFLFFRRCSNEGRISHCFEVKYEKKKVKFTLFLLVSMTGDKSNLQRDLRAAV